MREIQPEYVGAGFEQPADHLRRGTGWAEGRHDLGSAMAA
jgi:hypothetical protein